MSFIKRYIQGKLKSNCYIFYDESNIAIIYPGEDGPRIEGVINSISSTPKVNIFLTHGHADQILSVPYLVQKFPKASVYVGRSENLFLYDAGVNLSRHMGNVITFSDISDNVNLLTAGEEIKVGKYVIRVLETPGHTPGSVSYIVQDKEVVFTGDTILREAIGGTRLPFGDEASLQTSIHDKILVLPAKYKLFPAHGEPTDVQHELEHNPYVLSLKGNES